MQSVSFRIWTRVAVFISYGDNNYTTGHSYDAQRIMEYVFIAITPITYGSKFYYQLGSHLSVNEKFHFQNDFYSIEHFIKSKNLNHTKNSTLFSILRN